MLRATRVLILDEQPLVRAGLRALLEHIPTVEVVGGGGLGAARALALIRAKRPQVVLLSLGDMGFDGLATVAGVARKHPGIPILVVSIYSTKENILQALAAGASGYLLKKTVSCELERAIQTLILGELFLCPTIPRRTRDACLQTLPPCGRVASALTRRQRQILKLIAESKTTKEIASLLRLSPKTVEFHRAQLMTRLRTRDVAGLVRYAMRAGLVPFESHGPA